MEALPLRLPPGADLRRALESAVEMRKCRAAFVAYAAGRVLGGHVAHGCTVRTTAEVLLLLLPDWVLTRELDPATGFPELVVGKPALATAAPGPMDDNASLPGAGIA